MIGKSKIIFLFYFLQLISKFFFPCHFIFVFGSYQSFDVCLYERILLLVLLIGVLVFKFGGHPSLFHALMFPYFW